MALHVQKEINKLKNAILDLSTMVEDGFQKAIRSMENRDVALAQKVMENDIKIDQTEIDVEEECLKILALHQPVATDLRFIVSVLKINNDLELIGDLAANLAERVISLSARPENGVPFDFAGMAHKVQGMVKNSLDAMVNLDTQRARLVCAQEDEVDTMCDEAYELLREAISRKPEHLDNFLDLLSVSSYLERIADHAKKIAEDVIYTVEGEIVRHRKSWNTYTES